MRVLVNMLFVKMAWGPEKLEFKTPVEARQEYVLRPAA
jgi:hypothetical protein